MMKEDFHPGLRGLQCTASDIAVCQLNAYVGVAWGRGKEVGEGVAKRKKGSSACQSHGVDNLFQFTSQSLSPGQLILL